MTKVAVVILNFNGEDYLKKFLPGVVGYSKPYSVVVVDNASTDRSVEIVKTQFPDVRVIIHPRNEGFCRGYNLALQQIDAQYYVLLNSDVEVTSNWIDPIIEMMEGDLSIGACQPKILSYHHKQSFEYAGAGGGFIDNLAYPFCRGRLFSTLETDNGQYDDIREVFWASGTCLFIRSELFHGTGGFDEIFYAHMEEIDLCWRIQLAGFRIFYNGNSAVYHIGGGTLPKSNPQKTFLNFRNGMILLFKNSPSPSLSWKITIRIILDLIASLKFLLFDSWKDSLAVIRADWYFITHLSQLRAKRKEVWSKVKNKPLDQVYSGFLVWDYFMLQKKQFRDLNF